MLACPIGLSRLVRDSNQRHTTHICHLAITLETTRCDCDDGFGVSMPYAVRDTIPKRARQPALHFHGRVYLHPEETANQLCISHF